MAAPTPIPALAPVDKPELPDLLAEIIVGVAVAIVDVAVAIVDVAVAVGGTVDNGKSVDL